jgi:hypothetical protein
MKHRMESVTAWVGERGKLSPEQEQMYRDAPGWDNSLGPDASYSELHRCACGKTIRTQLEPGVDSDIVRLSSPRQQVAR